MPDVLNFQVGQQFRSDPKVVGNFRFKILVFPSGTSTTGGHQVSAFVEADPLPDLDPRWLFQGVKYQVTLINWLDYRKSVNKSDTWGFSKDGVDRGWHDMVKVSELTQETGWLGPDNTLCIRAQCYVRQGDSINYTSEYNAKKETGFVGLKNHGATCYMNGLLQSLFHCGEFRRIVYSIDCEQDQDPDEHKEHSISKLPTSQQQLEDKAPPLIQALQNVFYKLYTSDQAVDCKELMRSFGWDTTDAFTQHDAQELNRILCDRLEEQMKGTSMKNSIKELFEGEMENYIECINVDYKSKRNETFYDIQLNIKSERGHELRSIEESMREFTAEETLDGDNLYEAEGHGKQAAKKGIRFLRFPPVLNLQLKRFHFDLEKMDMVKLNTRFEFQKRLDLSSFVPGAGSYVLYAVLVHSGDVNSGHYYAFIRPDLDKAEKGWHLFDDVNVTPCSEYAAVNDNYAGSDLSVWNYFDKRPSEIQHLQPPTRPRIHSAYILVYVREDVAHKILAPPDPKLTNPKMVARIERDVQIAEQRLREKKEQQTKIKIKLVLDRCLCKMTGFWEFAEIPHEHSFKLSRDQKVQEWASTSLQELLGVPHQHLALFFLQYRHSAQQVRFAFMPLESTFRAHICSYNAPHFDVSDPHLTVLVVAANSYSPQTLKPMLPGPPDELAAWVEDKVLLLIAKYFCATTRKIVTLGCYYTKCDDSLATMVSSKWLKTRLQPYIESKEVAPLSEQDLTLPVDAVASKWQCWEEFSAHDVQKRTFVKKIKDEGLVTGDIIVWQLSPPDGELSPEVDRNAPMDGEVAPVYPVETVHDLAIHQKSAVDVVVTLHDYRQPLCVDGVVSNGQWGPPRPASAAAVPPLTVTDAGKKKADGAPPSPANKEERPEDAALALSLSKFEMPQERELKMDFRWQLQHLTGTVARTFGLRLQGESRLWFFSTAPSSTSEDPLNVQASDQPTLKELLRMQMHASSGRRQLHAVELPPELGPQVFSPDQVPLCIRFFDSAVREVGCVVIVMPVTATVADVLKEVSKPQHLQPQWGIAGPLRVLEVSDGRLLRIHGPEAGVHAFACCNRSNIFYNCLRVEADTEANLPAGHELLEIYHCDRQSQVPFGQPVLLAVAKGEESGAIKSRCKSKLQVPDNEFKSWRLVRYARAQKVHLKDDEPWDRDAEPEAKLYLEHVHPNPMSGAARHSRYHKPLTIKA